MGSDRTPNASARSVVEAAFARLNAHDLDGYHALLHDDVVVTGTGETRGLEANRALDTAMFGATSSATQKSFEVEVCDIIEVRDGRIASLTTYGDWTPMYHALQA
jgi:ketosteroid isomerase-like protein